MERERCALHGLAVGEGGCVRCRRDAQRRANRRGLALLAGVALAGAGAIVAARFALDARSRAPHVVAAAEPTPTAPAAATTTMVLPTTTMAVPATTVTGRPATLVVTDVAAHDQRVQEAMRSVSVTIYTTQYCGWCKRTKTF
ncbi:MAG TPA: hypothetical protein VIF62_21760, partial [Labilithrix sp.]